MNIKFEGGPAHGRTMDIPDDMLAQEYIPYMAPLKPGDPPDAKLKITGRYNHDLTTKTATWEEERAK